MSLAEKLSTELIGNNVNLSLTHYQKKNHLFSFLSSALSVFPLHVRALGRNVQIRRSKGNTIIKLGGRQTGTAPAMAAFLEDKTTNVGK